jgi:hypothetical protein
MLEYFTKIKPVKCIDGNYMYTVQRYLLTKMHSISIYLLKVKSDKKIKRKASVMR